MSDRLPVGGRAAGKTGRPSPGPRAGRGAPTIFFLSGYGLEDEFVGVVHAVLRRRGPMLGVVDLTHGIAPYDVRGGEDPATLGAPLAPGTLVAPRAPLVERPADGGPGLRAEIVWCDRFGNLQLAAAGPDGPPLVAPPGGPRHLEVHAGGRRVPARRVTTFSSLDEGELGLIEDSTGRLALVVREGSAAETTGARPGSVVELAW